MKSSTRLVFLGLLAIGLLELGVTHKFAALWQMAFTGTPTSATGATQATTGPATTGPTTPTNNTPPTMTF